MFQRIKQLRLDYGLTQIEVSAALKVDQSYYSKLELGKRYPKLNELISIACFFDVSLDYLIGRTDVKSVALTSSSRSSSEERNDSSELLEDK